MKNTFFPKECQFFPGESTISWQLGGFVDNYKCQGCRKVWKIGGANILLTVLDLLKIGGAITGTPTLYCQKLVVL